MGTVLGRKQRLAIAGLVMAVGLLGSNSAFAQSLQLKLEQGATTLIIHDNQPGDTNPLLGVISFSGAVGVLNDFNVFAALSKPALGWENTAAMDAFINITNLGTGGPLTVSMTDTDFPGVINAVGTLTSALGGTKRNVSGSLQAYFDPSNTPFGTGAGTCTTGPQLLPGGSGTVSFDDTTTAACPVNGPFSLTIVDSLVVGNTAELGLDHEVLFDTPVCGTIGDFVWYDTNHNGIQDGGEPGINGVKLFLESGGMVLATTTTGPHPIGGAPGYYQFPGACAGEYQVLVDPTTVPVGYVATLKDAGGDDAADNDSNGGPVTVVLPTDGASDQTIDFGFHSPCTGTIGDFVWNDLNQNGVQDAGEPGIAGISVHLIEGNQTAVTNGVGYYQFSGLCAGTYTVEIVTPPAGMTPSPTNVGDPAADSNPSPTVAVLTDDNSSDQTLDFGFYTPCTGEIGDFVWLDTNRNGIQDAGEPGIQGVTVRLKTSGGVVIATAITDVNGYYLFPGRCGGDYIVEVEPASVPPTLSPSPSLQGGDTAKDSNGSPTTVTLPNNTSDLTLDFGYMPPCTGLIGDYVWHDANRNGIQDGGELGIPGVQLELHRASDNSLIGVTTTDANGFYQFVGLCSENYKVVVTPPAGYTATVTGAGTPATDSNPNPALVSLPAHDSQNLTIDFGFYRPAALGDFVWYDMNVNGLQDAGEPGIGGVLVTLLACDGTPLASMATNAAGLYLFQNLVPGCYKVQFTTPATFTQTTANAGGDAIDSDAGALGMTGNYNLASGETNLTVDAGYYKTAALGDFVWNDKNSNGIQEAGEPGIPGVLVTLLRCDGAVVSSMNTDANGKYLFTNLLPGCYKVTFGTPTGYTASPANVGANDAVDSDSVGGTTGNYTLVAGETNLTVDAGFYVSTPICIDLTFDFASTTGSSTSGTKGNIRTFTVGGVSVNASAWSRDKSSGAFYTAFLGRYSHGLGVTDGSEDGSNNSHVVDNSGRDNYVMFEFSQPVVLDKAYLAYIVGDSDVSVWIGTVPNAFDSHVSLNAAVLTGLGFTEVNTGGSTDRWAELNAAGVSGNVIVIAARVGESTDGFKLKKLDLGCPTPGDVCVPGGTLALTSSSVSSTYGTKGNVRTYSVNGVNVKAAAFSRADSTGAWDKAFLGSYGSAGLGVTDTSEGDGSNNRHKVDNIGGRNNYIMFAFSQAVEVSQAFLDYVGADSDISVWVGNVLNAHTTPPMLSDALLAGFTKEDNSTTSAEDRWADFNAAHNKGNVFIISGLAGDDSPEDAFKVSKLDIRCK
jgi:hypothetical protein